MRLLASSLCLFAIGAASSGAGAAPKAGNPGEPPAAGQTISYNSAKSNTAGLAGNPLGGIGLSVEESGRTTMVQYNNAADAQAACTAAGGAFSASAGKLKCANPRTPLASNRMSETERQNFAK